MNAYAQLNPIQIDDRYVEAVWSTESGKVFYLSRNEKIIFRNIRITLSLNFYDGYNSNVLLKIPGSFATDSRFKIEPFGDDKLLIIHEELSPDTYNDLFIYDLKKNSIHGLENQAFEPRAYHQTDNGIFSICTVDSVRTAFYNYSQEKNTLLFSIPGVYENIAVHNHLIFTYKNTKLLEVFDRQGKQLFTLDKSNIKIDKFLLKEPNLSFGKKAIINRKLVLNFENLQPSVLEWDDSGKHFKRYSQNNFGFGKWFTDKKGNSIINQNVDRNSCENDLNFFLTGEKVNCFDFQLPIAPKDISSTDFSKHIFLAYESGLFQIKTPKKLSQKKLSGASMRVFKALDDKKILVGTEEDGIFEINRISGEVKPFLNNISGAESLNGYRGFVKDFQNNYWITSLKGFHIFSADFSKRDFIESSIRLMFQLNNGNVFTESNENLFFSSQLSTRTISAIENIGQVFYVQGHISVKNPNQAILFGTQGLSFYDDSQKQVIDLDTGRENLLSGLSINDSIFWLGSESGLLSKNIWDGKKVTILESYQIGNAIASITPVNGQLWLGTFDGVAVFDTSNKQHTYLDKSLLSHHESNRFSNYYDRKNGKLYLGTVDGFTIIDVDKFDFNQKPFNLYFSSITQSDANTDKYLESSGFLNDNLNISLPADKRYLRLRYSANTALENKNITYYYKINDAEWVSNQSQNELLFPFLASGKHEIQIYAINSRNERSSNTLKVTVSVDNYIYQKWWFISGIIVALLAFAVYWLYRIKNENKRLEFTVKERTKELENDKKIIEKQSLELKELDELKNQFFTNLSHELRTPLTLILSPLEQLIKGNLSKEKSKEYLALMKDNGDLLKDRIAEMLELSRLTARKVELSKDTFLLPHFLDKNTRILKGLALEKQIDLSLSIDVEDVSINSDEKRLGKIIQNLLSNALKFTPSYGKVALEAFLKNGILHITVEDNGIGIKETDKKKILERFYQVKQNDQAANPGTGIGLTMVKEYVDLMGGSLEIKSEYKHGATFKVKVPVEIVATTAQNFAAINETIENAVSHKPVLVLVEDNHQLRAYIKDLLAPKYLIRDFENGLLALKYLQANHKVDCILSDIMMPEMDGMQLLEEVRRDTKLCILPFVFLTSKHNETDKLKSFKMGVDDYLTKPFEEEQLKSRLSTVIKRYNTRLEASQELKEGDDIASGEFAHQLQRLIYENLNNVTFSTTFLAEKFNLSRRQFIRVVKKEIGLSPMAYIQEIRLNKARSIIENGQYESLKEVVETVGLKETRYFKKLYFERFGTSLN